jgi:hypothetical protein
LEQRSGKFRRRHGSGVVDLITENDFFAGLLAVLAERGTETVSLRDRHFDAAMAAAADWLREQAPNLDVQVDFRMTLHPLHGVSPTLQSCISSAVQDDIVSLDNPEYQDLRIKLNRDEAEKMLEWLPGDRSIYEGAADRFFEAYLPQPKTA